MSELLLPIADDTFAGTPEPRSPPWGWWDLLRMLLLFVPGAIALFFVLVGAMVVRQLHGTREDLLVLTGSIEVGIYALIVLAVYWCTVRRYKAPWATLGLRWPPGGGCCSRRSAWLAYSRPRRASTH